jgi:hypothetical protein
MACEDDGSASEIGNEGKMAELILAFALEVGVVAKVSLLVSCTSEARSGASTYILDAPETFLSRSGALSVSIPARLWR